MTRFLTAILMVALLLGGTACMALEPNCYDTHGLDNPRVTLGVENLLNNPEYFNLVKGKRVGLVTNPTGADHNLVSTIDLLHENPDVNLVALYGPEHGVRGDEYAGDSIADAKDEKTGVPMISLYGAGARRPAEEVLKDVDVLIYDIQDIGSRSYTYIYTMSRTMEMAGKVGIPYLVLDRPNPCGGNKVSGNVLHTEEGTSGVGLYAIPYMYGMTPGELAKLFNENFLNPKCNLTVVPMTGYQRDMLQWDTGLPFVPSSPNVPHAESAFYYNLTGIVGELNDVSIGVGYPLAFELIAAPFIDRDQFVAAIKAENIPGVKVRPITYKPYAYHFEGEVIHGAQFFISDYQKIQPVEAQIHVMAVLQRLYPDKGLFSDDNKRAQMFDKVMGTKSIRRQIAAGESPEKIIAGYQAEVAEFMKLRAKYLMYQ